MTHFLVHRIAQSLLVMFAMSLLVFMGVYAIGDPIALLVSPQADQSEIAAVTSALGLDRPVWEQYFFFLRGALTGNLGNSFVHGAPAMQLILEKLPATLELAALAMLIAVVLGIPLGLIAGLQPHSLTAKAIMAGSILGFSLPTFWVGLMLVMLFSVMLGWLPAGGRGATTEVFGLPLSIFSKDGWSHIALPAINLALFKLALIVRLTRAGTREALLQEYVKFAHAKGLHPRRIVGVHVLKNILIPIVTVLGLEFGSLMAFSVVTESVFAWPGMGKLLIDSIGMLDRPVVVAYLMLVVIVFVIINLMVDILYAFLDPRVRLKAK